MAIWRYQRMFGGETAGPLSLNNEKWPLENYFKRFAGFPRAILCCWYGIGMSNNRHSMQLHEINRLKFKMSIIKLRKNISQLCYTHFYANLHNTTTRSDTCIKQSKSGCLNQDQTLFWGGYFLVITTITPF